MKTRNEVLAGILGIFTAFLLGGIVLAVQHFDPIQTFKGLFDYSLLNPSALATTLKNAVPLLLTGLSASLAFAAGIVYLGQHGSLILGGIFATVGGLYITNLPPPVMIPLLMVFALCGGAIWSGICALMKNRFNMDVFISSLMMNMIMGFFIQWLINTGGPLAEKGAYSPKTPLINKSAWMPEIGPDDFSLSILIGFLIIIVMWVVINRFSAGYEWRLTGQNSLFSRIGGVEVEKNFMTVMLISGALAGLAGGLMIIAGPHSYLNGLEGTKAWDGVLIATVANNSVTGTLLYALFFSAIQTGAIGMEITTAVPYEFIQVFQSVIVLIVVAGRGVIDSLVNRIEVWRQANEKIA